MATKVSAPAIKPEYGEGIKMKTEKIIKVKKTGRHEYDDTQRETAIYAKSDQRPGYRWYIGYGSDYVPANKADISNIIDIVAADIEASAKYTEMYVHRYRHSVWREYAN